MKRAVAIMLVGCSLGGLTAEAQSMRERGVGPYILVTKRGEITVRLLRREDSMIWVDRLVQSGQYVETGIPRSEIVEFKQTRPRLFQMADEAASAEQIGAAIDQLRRLVAQLKPYRDLPGMPVNEALILQGKLNERRAYWRDAIAIYQELLAQPYEFKERAMIRYWAGLCLWRMGQKDKALEFLLDDPVPDDDIDLMSDILFARADCLTATGRHREAIDTFLNMIVFYPYVQTNELRALSGILPNYTALNDWDAAVKTIEALKRDYAEAPQTIEAIANMEKYSAEVEKEKQFRVVEE